MRLLLYLFLFSYLKMSSQNLNFEINDCRGYSYKKKLRYSPFYPLKFDRYYSKVTNTELDSILLLKKHSDISSHNNIIMLNSDYYSAVTTKKKFITNKVALEVIIIETSYDSTQAKKIHSFYSKEYGLIATLETNYDVDLIASYTYYLPYQKGLNKKSKEIFSTIQKFILCNKEVLFDTKEVYTLPR